jgi:hypothetical protein
MIEKEKVTKFVAEKTKMFKKDLRNLLESYDYNNVDKILIHLGENTGIKGGEITIYF